MTQGLLFCRKSGDVFTKNAELEKELSSASRESIQKKPETQRKLSELDELRRTVEVLPPEILKATKR